MKCSYYSLISALLYVFCVYGVSSKPAGRNSVPAVEDPTIITKQGLARFSINLLKETSRLAEPNLNIVLSPFSVWTVLLLVYEGAKGNTAAQISQALGFPNKRQIVRKSFEEIEKSLKTTVTGVTLESVNGLFTDKNRVIDRDFDMVVKNIYHSNILPIDFSKPNHSANLINEWVKRNTKYRIQELIRPEDLGLAQLVLANVIYFKGAWALPFNQSATEPKDFLNEAGKVMGTVDMMNERGPYQFSLIPSLDSQVVELPYQDSTLAMLVILPQMGINIDTVLEKLSTNVTVTDIYNQLQADMDYYGENDVYVSLPRFKVTSDLAINAVLEEMGIEDAFLPSKANFPGITDANNSSMFISRAMHKAEIEVTEEGTTASAITSSIFGTKSTTPHFKANKPFIFLIVEKTTKIILFAGKFCSPETYF